MIDKPDMLDRIRAPDLLRPSNLRVGSVTIETIFLCADIRQKRAAYKNSHHESQSREAIMFTVHNQQDVERSGISEAICHAVLDGPLYAVRFLGTADLADIRTHLLNLSAEDRDHRFHAYLDDDAIAAYVDRVDFSRMIMTGAFDEDGAMVGLAEAHLDNVMRPAAAEVCVSVNKPCRRRGLGRDLVSEVQKAASARGASRADFYFQPDNRAIKRLIASFDRNVDHGRGYSAVLLESIEDRDHAPLAA